jgi:hypothetical protein
MSAIRLLIALYFLITGLETELRADVSQLNNADLPVRLQPDKITNPSPIKATLEMDPWILSAPPIDPIPQFAVATIDLDFLTLYPRFMSSDSFRCSGNIPPTIVG